MNSKGAKHQLETGTPSSGSGMSSVLNYRSSHRTLLAQYVGLLFSETVFKSLRQRRASPESQSMSFSHASRQAKALAGIPAHRLRRLLRQLQQGWHLCEGFRRRPEDGDPVRQVPRIPC